MEKYLGQSAIEYLMTYGWMLLVVVIVGSAIFALIQQQDIESVSGFTGGDVVIDDFGTTSNGKLQLLMRNTGSNEVKVNSVNISIGNSWTEWTGTQDIGVGGTESVTLANVTEGDSANNMDATVNYDSGGLEDLEASGSISGSFEIFESGSSSSGGTALPDAMTTSDFGVTEQ